MKIVGISFSPRKKGNSVILLEEALKGAEQEGAQTELVTTAGMNINGCNGCNSCIKTGECHIKDDVQMINDKMIEADGIVFSTPIYFYGMAAQAKAVVDRTYSLSSVVTTNRPERSLSTPEKARLPIVLANDYEALEAAISMCGPVDENSIKIVWITNTSKLDEMYISEGLIPTADKNPDIKFIGDLEYINFDEEGNIAHDYFE